MASQETYIKYFRHFAYRLSGRYGILITFEHYCELCSEWPDDAVFKKRHDRNAIVEGVLKINGFDVLVRKDLKKHKMLLTVLPIQATKRRKKNELIECENV